MTTSLTSRIKEKAHQLGFSLVGVTNAEQPIHLDIFCNWIAAGRHGEMDYLATERSMQRRADPRAIVPECKSILVLATPYSKPVTELKVGDGRVAAYATGEDYHVVLRQKMSALVDFIESEVSHPVPNRWYTDSGPLLERELAQRAGLGWIGKNTMLINPQAGSYFLLSEILLGIELEYDQPVTTDHCGTCTRCIEACPTECILPNRTLDATRCISYLTIELKGAIEPNLRSKMGDWVFGCDVCQMVCPWNERFAPETGNREFVSQGEITLRNEMKLDTKEFNAKFKHSPVQHTKRRGYLRNVAVALGNRKDSASLPALTNAILHDPDPLVRRHAAWAIGQIDTREATSILNQARVVETNDFVLQEINAALNETPTRS